jgi:hypothetical protein
MIQKVLGSARLALLIIAASIAQVGATPVLVDSDDASASVYADGWNNFDNGSINPNGLGGWVLGGGASDPSTIGIASSLGLGGGSGVINSSGVAFKLHDTSGGFVDVFRFFDPAGLNVGETFSMDLAVNFRGGFKGMDLRDTSDSTVFNFNIGGDDYRVNQAASGNGSIGNAYSNNTTFALSFTQTTATGGDWTVVRGGAIGGSLSGKFSGTARSFKLYSGSQGSAPENAIYYNNMRITAIPEASSVLAIGVLALGAIACRWRSGR